jgi:hypothetical protein
MNHCDAEISDIVVIFDARWADKTAEAVELVKKAGMSVQRWDDDEGLAEGSIDACKVPELEKMDCVEYVRKVFTYIADYPRGDPRDLDTYEDED